MPASTARRGIYTHVSALYSTFTSSLVHAQVRDSEGNLVQFLYGEDGLDVCSTSYLQTGDGSDGLLTFLARNYHALTYKYSLHSDVFQRSGLDLNAAPSLHEEVQRARTSLQSFVKESAAHWVPAKGDTVEVRGRLDDSGAWEASNLGAAWRTGRVTKVRAKKGGEGYFDVEVCEHVAGLTVRSIVDACFCPLRFAYILAYLLVWLLPQLTSGEKWRKVPLTVTVSAHVRPWVSDPVSGCQIPRTFPFPFSLVCLLACLLADFRHHVVPFVQVLSRLNLSHHVGVVSERFQDALEKYIKRNPASVLTDPDAEVCC
jgi:hypothetical protein